MSADEGPPRASETPIHAVMDLQIKEGDHPESIEEYSERYEVDLDELIQKDGIPGQVSLEETLQESIASEKLIGVVPKDAITKDQMGLGAPTERYQHSPLTGPDEIRCLVLESGTGDADDPLVCSLHHHNLDDEPDFEAISYV